jgi:transposase
LIPLELFAVPAGSRLDRAVLDGDTLTVVLATTASTASCPLCGSDARRVHSRYTRRLADLPCFGRTVRLQVTVRRFSCPEPKCPRRIFAERLPGFAAPRARTTARLRQAHGAIGCALGGEAGSRLTIRLSMTTSPDTLLRRVKQLKDESAPPPRFVGIDDWAWRKGRHYGTIVVDLERGRVIDLLPDRDSGTVKAWLAAHPGVELISRDRWSDYAQAAAEAAPNAQQVADRWHLLKNLREAIERLFERQSGTIEQALKAAEPVPGPVEAPPATPAAEDRLAAELSSPPPADDPVPASPRHQADQAKRQRRVERFERVHELHRRGQSVRSIAKELGLSRNAVRRYLRRESCPDWRPGRMEPSKLDDHRAWIDRHIAAGGTNAAELHRELATLGYRVSYPTVRRYVTKRLAAAGKPRTRVNAAKPPAPPLPSPKQLSFDWVRRREDREDEQQARLEAIRSWDAELSAALDLADEFADLIRKQSPGTLTDWLTKAESSAFPELNRFAEGIRRDKAAVRGAVTEPWSNGPVEGHVNRLKTIKRQMYGRAGFVLVAIREALALWPEVVGCKQVADIASRIAPTSLLARTCGEKHAPSRIASC